MNFDRIAPYYDRLERWFARGRMHDARTAHLADIPVGSHALLVGEGPGRYLKIFLRQFPDAHVTCVDSSARMLALATARISEADRERVEFVQADIRTWRPAANQYDLLVTNFFLDCFRGDELARLIPVLSNSATCTANWLIADFSFPERGFRRWRAAIIITALYQFFRMATGLSARRLISPDPELEQRGFRLKRRVEFDHQLLRSDWWTREALE